MSARLAQFAPRMLSILRIMAALIFLEHGTQKLLGFPPGSAMPPNRRSFASSARATSCPADWG